jgi:uncharacterized protein YdaU (DUF1376 family)
MKFYKREPDNFAGGVAELTLEQIGAYTLLIDLLYARDGLVPNDDASVARMLHLDIRLWRRMKRELMAAGKVHLTNEGLLTANGVGCRLRSVRDLSEIARKSATHRWDLWRLAKKNNDPAMRERNAINSKSKSSEIPSAIEHAKPLAVDNGDNANGEDRETTTKCVATSQELKASIHRKWLGQ